MRNQRLIQVNILAFICLATVATLPEVAWAKRTVFGHIKDGTGKPIAGLLVEAWDDDPDIKGVSQDDFMGSAHTDNQGNYRVSYEGKHWDTAPHRITTWRPDIYIKVKARSFLTGDWAKVYESKVNSNQRMADDLRIDATVAPNQVVARRTQFNPFSHGWPFENKSAKICFAPTCDKEHWLAQYTRHISTFRWALCGGMSLSALRHFQNGAPVAPFSPQIKEELVKAQLDTIGPGVWAKFIEWQAKPTKPHTFGAHTIGVSTKGEWPKVKSAIDRGAPIVLGLIRVQADNLGGLDPVEAVQHVGNNHQVLAIGYDYHQLTQDTIIWVYDPNSPNSLSKISMNLGLPENQIKAEQRTYWSATKTLQTRPDNVRGFFVIGDSSAPPKGPVVQPTAAQQAAFQELVALMQSKDTGKVMTR